jgi:glycerophosphoryl diester phosphodiesterase
MKDLSYLRNNAFAHRGLFNRLYPENTIGAFKNAIDKNIGIELDVHLLKDNTIVVFHDDDLKRMADIDLKLREVTYDDIKKIKIGNTKYTIPKLEDVLKLVDGKVPLIIELKHDRKVGLLENKIFKLLDRYNGWFCIKSFSPFHMRYVRKHRPDYIRGLLILKKHTLFHSIASNSLLFRLLVRPDFLSCQKYLYKKGYVKRFSKRKPVLGWVIVNKAEMEFYREVFDSIIFEVN